MTGVFEAYAAYYDLLYRDKDYPGESRYVQSLLKRHGLEAGALLELGCGTGKHADQLARLGYRVHGVDSSAAMVERARESVPADLRARLRFETGDARSARLAEAFDAVISLFHVASYQSSNEDLAAMFATAGAHLKSGGLFVFDFWYGPGVLTVPPSTRVKRLEDEDLVVTRIAEPTLQPNRNIVDVRYTVLVKRRSTGETFEFEETHRMRYLFLPELELMLQASGLQVLHAERWMSGELDLTSWLGVIVARRGAPADHRREDAA
ncbi:MAG TPA: class I SAM-dependent methyltransferase [Steroidobacteraceae bacterium]|jgi:SAM-dependent methyltransferase|nr:class I SAM-dependent methyltransferase [Steroidobacteraceae bacterium]